MPLWRTSKWCLWSGKRLLHHLLLQRRLLLLLLKLQYQGMGNYRFPEIDVNYFAVFSCFSSNGITSDASVGTDLDLMYSPLDDSW